MPGTPPQAHHSRRPTAEERKRDDEQARMLLEVLRGRKQFGQDK